MDCPKCGYKAGTQLIDLRVPTKRGEQHCCALNRYYKRKDGKFNVYTCCIS